MNIKFLFKILLAIVILVWLARSEHLNIDEIKKIFHPFYFTASLLTLLGSMLLVSERFRLLLKTQNVHLTFWQGWQLYLIGHLFNYVLPGGVGGDLVKAYYLKKERSQESKSSPFTFIFDRAIGLYVMMLMALVALIINFDHVSSKPQLMVVATFVGGVFVALNLLALAAFNRKLRHLILGYTPAKLHKLHRTLATFMTGFEHYAKSPAHIWQCLAYTGAAQILMVLTIYIAGVATGDAQLPLKSYFFVAPVGMAVTGLPISPPGGIGVGQAAFLVLFNMYLGYSSTLGATVITVFQFLSICIGFWGLYFYLTRKKVA